MAGVATASYAFPLTPVSSKEAGACQGFGIHGHVALGHGRPHCRLQEAPRGSAAWQHHGDPPEAPGGRRRFLRNVRGQEDHLNKLHSHPN